MPENPKFQTVEPNHPVSKLADALSANAEDFSQSFGMSKMDVCAAMANAIGHILFDAGRPPPGAIGKALPKADALKRMDNLRQVMEAAYELRGVEGNG